MLHKTTGASMETHLKVILVSHTPDPEKAISAAARLCYSPADIEQVISDAGKDNQSAFLEKLIAVGHLSPVEHASFTFAVEGISRACSHQLVRHRLASYSQQSQRYVGEEEGFAYVIPPAIMEDKELRAHFTGLMEEAGRSYKFIVERLREKGCSIESAREDARFVLPNAAETKIIITMNARELLHFFSIRLCNRAQWEIREMAYLMLKLARPLAPALFHNGGPPCLKGKCPEGSRTCGKTDEVRRLLAVE
jgi:thymidylate synthase (FAD)